MKKPNPEDLVKLGLDHPHLGLNDAGPGIATSDWQFGLVPTTGTDGRHDLAQEEERAERQEEDAREAKQLGEHAPDPVGDLFRAKVLHQGQPKNVPAHDPIMESIRGQIAEQEDK